MVFDKLFKKDKSKEYFLQIDTAETTTATEAKEEAPVATEEPTSESTEAKTEKTEAPAPVASTPSNVSYEVPDWVKAIKNYSQPESNGDSSTGNNFAGKYVTNDVAYSRRRPGGSLNKFKQMASKMGK